MNLWNLFKNKSVDPIRLKLDDADKSKIDDPEDIAEQLMEKFIMPHSSNSQLDNLEKYKAKYARYPHTSSNVS